MYDQSTGITPCVLLDGHGSQFGLPFLHYISEDPHQWCVVIRVPYGTALWQVGDSPEQNWSLNMASVKAKRMVVENKEKLTLNPTIEPYKIIGIVKYAWARSFARLQRNKNAISEQGWFPYNRNLLTCKCLWATMTKVEKKWGVSWFKCKGTTISDTQHNRSWRSPDLQSCPCNYSVHSAATIN